MSRSASWPRGAPWLLVAVPALVVALGVASERAEWLAPLAATVHSRSVPGHAMDSGRLARVLQLLGRIGAVPRNPKSARAASFHGTSGSRKRPAIYSLDVARADRLPSTKVVRPEVLATGVPVLSVVATKSDLYNHKTGILAPTNVERRGRRWETPAYVSYFDDGRLLFGSGAGLRVHGATSRLSPDPQSFRLYFRSVYGVDQFLPGALFDGRGDPLRRLIVHNDMRAYPNTRTWHFLSPMAYAIAERVGCIVPQTQPVRFFLNGREQGAYVLTERVDRHFLRAHFGHERFTVYDPSTRGTETPVRHGDRRPFDRFDKWARHVSRFTVEEVESRVDLENLTRWLLAMVWCATTDAEQGRFVLDTSRLDGKWFFVNLDMDHSFVDAYQDGPRGAPYELDMWGWVLRPDTPRARVLRGLLRDSPEFRSRLRERFAAMMNHQLTPLFLNELLDRYRRTARELGLDYEDGLREIGEFFARRSDALRPQLVTWLGAPASHRCTVTAPEGARLEIDGFPESPGYAGVYFHDTAIRVRLAQVPRGHSVEWRVDGIARPVTSTELTHTVTGDCRIDAAWTRELRRARADRAEPVA